MRGSTYLQGDRIPTEPGGYRVNRVRGDVIVVKHRAIPVPHDVLDADCLFADCFYRHGNILFDWCDELPKNQLVHLGKQIAFHSYLT